LRIYSTGSDSNNSTSSSLKFTFAIMIFSQILSIASLLLKKSHLSLLLTVVKKDNDFATNCIRRAIRTVLFQYNYIIYIHT
jgi:hypothetical protein